MDIAELHSRGLDATRGVIAGVRQGQCAAPTPREGWDVRALVDHVVSGNLWAAELAAGTTISEVGDHLDSDVLGADPLGAYDAWAKAAAAVFIIPRAQGVVRCLLRPSPWRGIRWPPFHRRAHPRLGRGRRHQAGYDAPPRPSGCVPRHRRPSSQLLRTVAPQANCCVPVACSVTESSWQTPAMRRPVCWPR